MNDREKNEGDGAQCSIHFSDENRSRLARMVNSVSQLRGVLTVEVDHLNHVMIVDYNPDLVSFREIRERARGKNNVSA